MKRSLIAGLILVVLLAGFWLITRNGPPPSTGAQTRTQKEGDKTAPRHPGENTRPANSPPPGRLPLVELKEVSYVLDYAALASSRQDPPFRIRGGAGTGKVVDRDGNVLIESGKEIGILGAAVGPDNKRVLVKGGDGINFVLTPATGEKLQLPVFPPGANMLGMGSWDWISESTLLGQSGVQALDKNGMPVKTDNNVAETKLYVYDLTGQRLTEVAMPAKVTQPLVDVMEVTPDGHVHLFLEQPRADTEQDLGWFKIEAPQ